MKLEKIKPKMIHKKETGWRKKNMYKAYKNTNVQIEYLSNEKNEHILIQFPPNKRIDSVKRLIFGWNNLAIHSKGSRKKYLC